MGNVKEIHQQDGSVLGCFQIELEFINTSSWGSKTGQPREKTWEKLRAGLNNKRTNGSTHS